MNIAELFVRVRGDTSDLTRKMGAAEKSIERFGKTAGKWLGLGLGAGFAVMVKESIEAQNALAQLEARIKSTGGAAGRSIDQLTAHASALQKVTTFSDDAVQGAQALLLTFKQIRGDEFDRATKATLDLATALNTDLKSAALQLGKALEDPTRGMTALRRSGVSFTKAQEDVIKKLVETGKVAEAQNLILAEMETQFGGAAEAARNTLGGALLGLRNAFTDTLEVSGDASTGIVGAINRMADAMPTLRRQFEDGFSVIREQLSMFKYDMVVTGGIVVTALTLMNEAAGRLAQALSFGKFGGDWVAQAKEMRRQIRATVEEARRDLENAGLFRNQPAATGLAGALAQPFRVSGLSGPSSGNVTPRTPPAFDPEFLKKQQDALWETIETQFKSAFDNLDEVIRSWSSGVAAALQSASDRIAQQTAGLGRGVDFAAIAQGGTAPQQFGFTGGQLNLDPEAQLAVEKLRAKRAEDYQKSDLVTGSRQVSKMDEMKAAILNQTTILAAATMALGDKILLGGGGTGSRTGGFIGGALLGAVGLGGGGFGKALGTVVGTMAGSLFGGLFDKGKEVDRATDSLERFRRELNRITAGLFNVPDAFKRSAWVDRFTDPRALPSPFPGGPGSPGNDGTGIPGVPGTGGTGINPTILITGTVVLEGVQSTSKLYSELERFAASRTASGNGTGFVLAGA